MVYGYRIILLDAGDLSRLQFAANLFNGCVLAPRALLKFISSSLFAYCKTTVGFITVGHATIFRVCVNLHVCGFQPSEGLQERFPVVARNADDTREAPFCTASPR